MEEKKIKLMLVGILAIILIFAFSITPTRLILLDEIKETHNTMNRLIKNEYITEEKLEQYNNCEWRLSVGNGGCKMYECNGKNVIVKGWYDWSDTISLCGLHN